MKCKSFLVTALLSLTVSANAADFPDKTISIVVPFPAGSSSDLIPRLVAPLMSQSMGVPVVVQNQPGANGSLGAVTVANAKPDGYTLLLGTTGVFAINQWIYSKPRYLPERDLAPVTNGAATPNALVVHPDVPARNLKELVALAKAEPGKLTYASAGNGSTSHLCGAVLEQVADVKLVHVPYKGPAPAMQDMLGGSISIMCDNFSNVYNHIQAGRLRAIAVTDEKRQPLLPDVPTSAEQGFPALQAGIWYGFAAPAGTPKAVIDKLSTEFRKAFGDSGVQERLNSIGLTVVADGPESFAKTIASDSARMHAVVKSSGAKVD